MCLSDSAPRIFFAHGPGDAAGTLKKWAFNIEDDSIIANTYSGQIFDLAKQLNSELLVIADNRNSYRLSGKNITVESFVRKDMGSGWRYWLNMKKHTELVARRARDFRADVAIVSLHYGLLSLAAFKRYQIPVILDMHNTLWPMGNEPNFFKRLLLKTIAIGGQEGLAAVIAVSPECGRQINRLITGKPIFEHIPQYPNSLQNININNKPVSPSEDFRILFSGRIEEAKGVFDLIDAAEILIRDGYSQLKWIIAGSGSAEPRLKVEIERRSLSPYFELKGQLCRSELTLELAKANTTITPTRAVFPEGLAKAPLESLIVGIPALLSSVVPAADVVANAALIFEPASPNGIARTIKKIVGNPLYYDSLCKNSRELRHLLFSSQYSFGNAVLEALENTLANTKN
ncbi:glycosyltransferase family 4 protein [SAR92 clade bacterium H231]|nr:glycosyltransferase family 4 protein [SAR92 clade bacterium H231]